MTDDDDVPEDKLLETPTQTAGVDLSRLWAIRSNLVHQRELDELNRELSGNAPPRMLMPWSDPHTKELVAEKRRREQRAYEQVMLQITERQDRLLQLIDQDQARIEERRKEIDNNALRLLDGRRVYVDGDRFRDEQGRVLTGVDEAEAARQHEYRPDASTWAEKQENERRAEEAEKLKQKILKEKETGEGTPEQQSAQLDADEKDFADKVQARRDAMNTTPAISAPAASAPDYGNGDYMAEYQLSSAPAFNEASGSVKTAPGKNPKEDDSETATQETKKPLQVFGQGGLKPG